jgi:hypothetical protein
MGMRRMSAILAVAVLVAGCSSSHKSVKPTPTSTTTLRTSAAVVRIDNFPNPEGPVAEFSASRNPHAFAVAIGVLPEVLPPSSEHQKCDLGGTVVLTLSDGSTRRYGPCVKPVAIARAMNALYSPSFQRDPPLVVVPNVVGKTAPQAFVAVASAQLVADIPPDIPMAWEVTRQVPVAGSPAKFNSTVRVNLCDPTPNASVVPECGGTAPSEAPPHG